jgi:hypothetical protein
MDWLVSREGVRLQVVFEERLDESSRGVRGAG